MNTPRNFALQLGALISLYVSLSFLVVLLFGVINVLFPDPVESYWAVESAQSSIRLGIAMVLVFFPTYLVLTRIINTIRRREPEGTYLTLTKWLIYLSLVVGGGVLLGDLVAVIMYFLDGEITQRFLLKVLTVLVVVGAAFFYYLKDVQGYWVSEANKSIQYGTVCSLIVLGALIVGFMNIASPEEARERRIDQQQINDLQTIQWQVIDYYRSNEALPDNLDAVFVNEIPQAPEGRAEYEYSATDDEFELCAQFAYPSNERDQSVRPPITAPEKGEFVGTQNWQYQAGEWCFERVKSVYAE